MGAAIMIKPTKRSASGKDTQRQTRQQRERKGRRAEFWARLYLRAKAYRIIAKRYKTPYGEIDIIAARGKSLAFIEVKARPNLDQGLWSVTPAQQKRISQAAALWLGQNEGHGFQNMSFDVVILAPGHLPRHIQHGFYAQ